MQYRLDLVLTPAEGALLRVIGMAERRGFAPRAIVGAPNAGKSTLFNALQIEKIYDCVSVRISALEPGVSA